MTSILLQRLGKDLLSEIYSYDTKRIAPADLRRELFWNKWERWLRTVYDPVYRARFRRAIQNINLDAYNFDCHDLAGWTSYVEEDSERDELELLFEDCSVVIGGDDSLEFDNWGEG